MQLASQVRSVAKPFRPPRSRSPATLPGWTPRKGERHGPPSIRKDREVQRVFQSAEVSRHLIHETGRALCRSMVRSISVWSLNAFTMDWLTLLAESILLSSSSYPSATDGGSVSGPPSTLRP